MSYNAAERKDIRRLEKSAALAERQRLDYVAIIMSTQPGRAWMCDFLERTECFRTPFTGEDSKTNFNCGVQSIGLQVLADVAGHCPDDYVLMMRERNGRRATDNRRNNRPDGGTVEHDDSGDDAGDREVSAEST